MGTETAEVLALVGRGEALLAGGRLLCIDGPAGSGKSTLARQVARAATRTGRTVAVICLDDLLAGWAGALADSVAALVHDVLEPLAVGHPAAYHRYDWGAAEFAEWVSVPACDLLVVEGVGSGSRAVTTHASAVVWVEAAPALRHQRGIARDGEAFAPHWESWAAKEAEHFIRERTRERADLVVTTG